MKKLTVIAILLALFSSCKKTGNDNNNSASTITPPGGNVYKDLFDFNTQYGENPYGALIIIGKTLYGMTSAGGKNGDGNIFSINTDGTGFTDMHDFAGGNSDGASPNADLTLSGGLLYGMTRAGGANSEGTIFSINPDGTGFKILYTFGNSDAGGVYPGGNLTISGTTMYGMTSEGGDSGLGNIFSISTTGSNYANLFDFTSTTGLYPGGSLVLSGTTLYGMVYLGGGPANDGVVFSFNIGGKAYTKLHIFTGKDGANPDGSLVLSGNTLYGATNAGGADSSGNIFSVSTTGAGFTDLYDFNLNTGPAAPTATLIINGNTLYGTTASGADIGGNVFSINTDGSGFKNLYGFNIGTYGSFPHGAVLLNNNILYGITEAGGMNGDGTIFSLAL